ncbi:MAG: AsmA family protein [Flavobacteriales bacterium]
MNDSQQTAPAQRPKGSLRRRLLRWAVVVVMVLGGFTAWLAWQAQGLEARVIEAVRPHLATDVAIGSVSVSLWSVWPDVEVILGDVAVEDAVDRGRNFLELQEVGFTVSCLPLLENRLEVKALRLEEGRIRLNRTKDGQENWHFWVDSDAEDGPALEGWNVDALGLREVRVEGSWAGSGASVTWDGTVLESDVALHSLEGGLAWAGRLDADGVELRTGDDIWVDGRALRAELEGRIEGDRVTVVLGDSRFGSVASPVPLTGVMESESGDFRMALSSPSLSMAVVEAVLPPNVRELLAPALEGVTGSAEVELSIGRCTTGEVWTGPEDAEWDGGWAVRLGRNGRGGLSWAEGPRTASWTSGAVVAMSGASGWKAVGPSIGVDVAEGEFKGSAELTEAKGRMNVKVDGRGVFRPAGVWPWLGLQEDSGGSAVAVSDGGRIDVQGSVELVRQDGQWADWMVAEGTTVTASDVAWEQDGAAMGVKDVQVEVREENQWTLAVSGVKVPGVEGSAQVQGRGDGGVVSVDLDAVDVDDVVAWWAGQETADGGTQTGSFMGGWDVEVGCGRLTQGPLTLDGATLSARFADEVLTVSAFEAEGMGGRLEATGRVDGTGLVMDGRLEGADLAQFMEETSGLGQATLLPRHVRGKAWVEGQVGYAFGRTGALPWAVDARVRLEDAELIGFELLQQIPDVLESERKYRMIADAQDLRRRLNRVQFEPMDLRVHLEQGLITVDPVEIVSDAMDVGVEGWHRLGGPMDFTLDFALRDLKSDEGEFGPVAEDGLGHRFFLAMRGTLEAPEFGYDRTAHKEHRRVERQGALDRLRGALRGEGGEELGEDVATVVALTDSIAPDSSKTVMPAKGPESPVIVDDDDDDF